MNFLMSIFDLRGLKIWRIIGALVLNLVVMSLFFVGLNALLIQQGGLGRRDGYQPDVVGVPGQWIPRFWDRLSDAGGAGDQLCGLGFDWFLRRGHYFNVRSRTAGAAGGSDGSDGRL